MSALTFPIFFTVSALLMLLFRLVALPRRVLPYVVLLLLLIPFFLLPRPLGVSAESLAEAGLALSKVEKVYFLILFVTALLWHLGTWEKIVKDYASSYEFYALFFFALAGGALFLEARNFLILFLGLELLSFSLYVLCSFGKSSLSLEAALKYFLAGALASSFYLLGLALYFGGTGKVTFDAWHTVSGIPQVLSQAGEPSSMLAAQVGPPAAAAAQAGLWLMLAVLFFKFALFPFFLWVPDVYQGAPFPVTAFMATAVKIAVFPVLARLLLTLHEFSWLLPLLFFVALFTQLAGNLLALAQSEMKRLLAYSSIAHAGYLSLLFLTKDPLGIGAFYLLAYAFMTLGSFFLSQGLAEEEALTLDELKMRGGGLPGALLSLFMLSLIGIPLTGGFSAKVFVFGSALQSGYLGLVLLALLNSVLSAGYYLKVPSAVFFAKSAPSSKSLPPSLLLASILCAVGTLLLGFWPFLFAPFFSL